MERFEIKNPAADLGKLGILRVRNAYWNLSPEALMEETVKREQGVLSNTGALAIQTGEFTGRSPMDRFIVMDENTAETVDWGPINKPIDPRYFHQLYQKITSYFQGKDV
ncbi:MAG: phosphoenolpyruvate carboxykinase (ATP), partial [Phaeodactylibacter sp.]|nr:phosphoenolpyruvate carboxykinase (ATP) [Phaeodactylibacter sp.]